MQVEEMAGQRHHCVIPLQAEGGQRRGMQQAQCLPLLLSSPFKETPAGLCMHMCSETENHEQVSHATDLVGEQAPNILGASLHQSCNLHMNADMHTQTISNSSAVGVDKGTVVK